MLKIIFLYVRLLRPVSVQGMMEHALQHRERVGVQDFVLLEDFRSEAAFIDNLKKRFNENIIYVSYFRHNYLIYLPTNIEQHGPSNGWT